MSVSYPFIIISQEESSLLTQIPISGENERENRENRENRERESQEVYPRLVTEKRNVSNSSGSKYSAVALHSFSDGKSLLQLCYNASGWLCG